MLHAHAPAPVTLGRQRVVAPDVESIDAHLRFDTAERSATGEATVSFKGGDLDGCIALDLRQELRWVRLDGEQLRPEDFPRVDLGAGEEAGMRVLGPKLEAGSSHRLELGYDIDTPSSAGAAPLGWVEGGLSFDFWMSDLRPGRYLEMWVPAPLVHDRFRLSLQVTLKGTTRPHTVFSNAARTDRRDGQLQWSLTYPEDFTALSPMLVVVPSDLTEVLACPSGVAAGQGPQRLLVARLPGAQVELAHALADLRSWVAGFAARYGRWTHQETFYAVLWPEERGMEYDGATTCHVDALEHEVFHSWFGRGVKPVRASDGWIDEAWTVWNTSSRRADQPRFAVSPLSLDEDPVCLYPPHPWSRHTPVEAYSHGARLFAAIADLLGGATALRAAMADWYAANAGGLVSTDGLRAHLSAWSGKDLSPWWARYVHGRS